MPIRARPNSVLRPSLALFIALGVGASPAVAQEIADTNAHDGKWRATIAGKQTANVVIGNFAGTWQFTKAETKAVPAHCIGKRFPITVQVTQEAKLDFTAWGSGLKPACPDITVELQPVDAKTLEGTATPGGAVRLQRRR